MPITLLHRNPILLPRLQTPAHWVQLKLDGYASLLIKNVQPHTGELVYRISNKTGEVIEGPTEATAQFEGNRVYIGSASISFKDYQRVINTLTT